MVILGCMELAVGWWMLSSNFCQFLNAISLHAHVAVISITFSPVPVIFIHDVTVLTVNACCRSQLVEERVLRFLLTECVDSLGCV